MDPYGTHQEALAWAMAKVANIEGSIVEAGCGWWSTPLLHGFAEGSGREILSLDAYPEYLQGFEARYGDTFHGFGDDQLEFSGVALALVDGGDPDRARYVNALRGNCAYLVCHDTEATSRQHYPGMEEALALWPNRREFARAYPNTTVVWS